MCMEAWVTEPVDEESRRFRRISGWLRQNAGGGEEAWMKDCPGRRIPVLWRCWERHKKECECVRWRDRNWSSGLMTSSISKTLEVSRCSRNWGEPRPFLVTESITKTFKIFVPLQIFGSESPDKIIICEFHGQSTIRLLRDFLPQIMKLVRCREIFLSQYSLHYFMLCFSKNRLPIPSFWRSIYMGYHFRFFLLCVSALTISVFIFKPLWSDE